MRSRASVPMAENMSAYLAICSEDFFAWAVTIIRELQKYGCPVNKRFANLLSFGARFLRRAKLPKREIEEQVVDGL